VPDATAATANAINNNGYVVGSFQRATTTRRAFLRNLAGGIVVLGEIISNDVEAVSISNNADRIMLSQSQALGYTNFHLNTPAGSFAPHYINLPGQPPFSSAEGRGINAHNVIVGEAAGKVFLGRASATGSSTAITDGVFFDLPGAASVRPYGINDHNQIVGTFSDTQAQQNAFLLNPCSPVLPVAARTHGSGGETGLIPLVTDSNFCLWIATADVPWISFTRSIGSGPGTVAYQLQPNPTNAERQAVIRIGAREFTITQASSDCRYTVSPNFPQTIQPEGGAVTYTIATAPNCPWTVSAPDLWIQVTPSSGTGNATVTGVVAPIEPQASGARSSQLNMAGVSVPVTQLPRPCEVQLSRGSLVVPTEGAVESIRVTMRAGCTWFPAITVPWVTTIGQVQSQGTGTLSLRIESNRGVTERTTAVVINSPSPSGPPAATISILQRAGAACTYALPADNVTAPAEGFDASFLLNTGDTCPFTPVSEAPWMRIVANPPGANLPANLVRYQVDPNPSRFPRRGLIRVAGLVLTVDQFGNPLSQLGFVPIPRCRIMDTRPDRGFTGNQGPPALSPPDTRSLGIFGRCGIPLRVRAVALDITAVPLVQLAYLTVFPGGSTRPIASTLNSWDGRAVSNLAIIPIIPDVSGTVSMFASDMTHVVADVVGYFVDPVQDSLVLYPVTPCRLLDTRTTGNAPIGADTTRNLPVTGQCGVPANAAALSLNVTGIPRNGRLAELTVYSTGHGRPLGAPINAAAGRVVASAQLLATGFGGSISIHASHEADVVVDVNGYFAAPSDTGLYFNAISPCRIADTRTAGSGGPLMPAIIRTFQPSGVPQCRVPAEARAHLVNATVVPDNPVAFLSLFPSPAWTGSSTLNAYDGQVTANLAIVPDNGQGIGALASSPTHLVLDSSGYFMAVPADQRRPVPLQ
jgi:probable HAF family extracellular repeat protein